MSHAPSARWRHPVWATAQKGCVGVAPQQSRVWFTVGRGILTEVFYPRIDIPQIRDLGFIIADDKGFWVELKTQPESSTELNLENPQIPLPWLQHRHERFEFSLRICPDPQRDVLLLDYELRGDEELRPYLLCAARLGGDAEQNQAWCGQWEGRDLLWAEQGPFGLALLCRDGDGLPAFQRRSVGEVGASDLWQDFQQHGQMRWDYDAAGPGEVALSGELPRQGTVALGLGSSKEAAATNAWASLVCGFAQVREDYSAAWQEWHRSHPLPRNFAKKIPEDLHALYARSVNVLKVHEDHTFPGARVASLSVPWGEASDSRGGYHLVWSRDLVESAGALVAIGALGEARQVLAYLISTQQGDGHWLQNQWLGGKPFWQGIQLDEAGFPVLLASMLQERQALDGMSISDMIRRALHFIVCEGPVTGQDRWEEDGGINAFTLTVAIAALVEGANFLGGKAAALALMLADYWNAHIEDWTFVRATDLAERFHVSGYYLRIAPADVLTQDGAKNEWVLVKNRAQDPHWSASEQVATDFLQLVRYGLRSADDPHIVASVQVMDGLLKTDTPNGPVWHRYNGDGYGEHADGNPFDGCGIGRGWPLLTGERGHYALAAGDDPLPYLRAMAAMTGKGGLLPEQVWDSTAIPEKGLFPGQPSGSAMPLVWTHGEFLKLCHSLLKGQPIDRPVQTWKRYGGKRPELDYRLWRLRHRPRQLHAGQELRLLLQAPFRVRWGIDGWQQVQDLVAEDWELGFLATLPVRGLQAGQSIQFTLFWLESNTWQGEDFMVHIIGGEE
ncbi:glycosyl hydrolase [Acidithiobacillus sp. CV18-2]|nr:glycosyl hydrolase [Acidithiobacillus sp. CV18-3]MBU2756905.1 glycosyl hydrolase [Acidithiobacillus sp. BN09-2]MBU2777997.1 glycosyl hydrolase [Acidithiobacillus sp. CV18-2]MBU2799616.1 glycosyl hydrolase [Acidithiobacillus sp. VAN18-4]